MSSNLIGWYWAYVGRWEKQTRRTMANYIEQTAETKWPRSLLARDSKVLKFSNSFEILKLDLHYVLCWSLNGDKGAHFRKSKAAINFVLSCESCVFYVLVQRNPLPLKNWLTFCSNLILVLLTSKLQKHTFYIM